MERETESVGMSAMEVLGLRSHASTSQFTRKVDKARAIIDNALALDVVWILSFSGGIDSTALLDLLNDAHLVVQWGDDGADYPETLQFLADTEQRYSFELQRIRCLEPWRDWCVEMGRPDLAEPGSAMDDAWMNPHQWHHTWQSLKDAAHHDYSGVFLGLLAGESRGRRMITHNGKRPLYQVKEEHGVWHCSPLASWTKQDIWSYIISRNIPYNPAYDKLAELGVPLEYRRVAPLTCFRAVQYGSVAVLRQGWPEMYNELSVTFPKVREYS
jgi:3'-phosphoadenosine 5'-phosphosulfate sulfotransferase (PAPS reductase)/FAD synthetase